MQTDFERRLETALSALAQFVPETKKEASRMTAEQWTDFQDAANECIAIHTELGGDIRHNGTWIYVGRYAAEQVNNASYRREHLERGGAIARALESGALSKDRLIELVRKFGLGATQEAAATLESALVERQEALAKHIGVLFSDKTAKALGVALPDPMCAETRSH